MAKFTSSLILLASLALTLYTTLTPVSGSRVIISDPNKHQNIDLNHTFITRPNTIVTIANLLGNGQQLKLHCQSKDDDVGPKYPLNDGQAFQIKFKPDFLGSTVFFCSFTWSGGSKSIDVYEYIRDHRRCCDEIPWKVEKKGLSSASTYNGEPDVFYSWT